MVLVNVDISNGEFDGNAYITSTVNPQGTIIQGSLVYDEIGLQMSNYLGRKKYPNTVTPTGYSTAKFNSRPYYIFEGITIPQGSTINDATFTFAIISENYNPTGSGTVLGRKTASPIPYTSNQTGTTFALQVFTKPVATAVGNFAWSGTPTTTQFASKAVDVKDMVQELVNTFDYDNDNMMFMLITPPVTLPPATATPTTIKYIQLTADNYEEQALGIPNLTINYTTGQICVPTSDISNAGSWEDVTLGNGDTELWDELDEIIPDDGSSAVRGKQNAEVTDTFEVKLDPCLDPNSSTGHIIRISARGARDQVKIQLFQGAGLIAESGNFTLTSDFQTFEYTLSGGEADSITDYNDLRIRVIPSVVP